MSIPEVTVPNEFCCPISSEVMVDPVTSDCPGTNSFFQRIFSSFPGHNFERHALAAWLERDPTQSCPVCRHRIKKYTANEALAKKIAEQFVNINEANRAYFENLKKQLDESLEYLNYRNNPPPQVGFFKRCLRHPLQTLFETLDPKSAIESFISQDDLKNAEQLARRYSNNERYYFLKCIAIAYIDRNYSHENLLNALRLIQSISWPYRYDRHGNYENYSEKDKLLSHISEKYCLNNNLEMAERVADLISSNLIKDQCYSYIASILIGRRYSDSNLEKTKLLASKMSVRNAIIIKIAITYARNYKYVEAIREAKTLNITVQRFVVLTTVYAIHGYKSFLTRFTSIRNLVNRFRA